MGTFYALNAGTADCLVMVLEAEGRSVTVLLDGGSKKDPRNPLHLFLKELEVEGIDLMITTHLHQDHLGFFPEVVDGFPVAQAVVVYPEIPLDMDDDRIIATCTEGQAATTRSYIAFLEQLRRASIPFFTTFPLTAPDFSFGDYRLRCLFPEPGAASPVIEGFRQVSACSDPTEAACIMKDAREYINADSSIWLLEREGEPLLLLCSDCLDEDLAKAIEVHQIHHVQMLKLSHHGRNDKGRIYYTPETVGRLSPDTLLVSASEEVKAQYIQDWKALSPASNLAVTCDQKAFFSLPI